MQLVNDTYYDLLYTVLLDRYITLMRNLLALE